MAKSKALGAKVKSKATKANGRAAQEKARVRATAKKADCPIEAISSTLSYEGPLFSVYTDLIRENDKEFRRDVIRHDGSVVILALEDSGKPADPLVLMERQYRHAAGQYLLEVPAGKLEEGEDELAGAKRELLEETGFRAKRWQKLVRYFASPGFLGESMQIFVAQGLTAGEAAPDDDEQIEIRMLPFSELLDMIEQGKIYDGKTLISAMLYDRLRRRSRAPVRKKK